MLIVKLFKSKTDEGIVIPDEEPPKTRFEAELVVRLDGVPAIEGPFNVRVFAPTIKEPDVKVRVELMVVAPLKLAAPAPDLVKLL